MKFRFNSVTSFGLISIFILTSCQNSGKKLGPPEWSKKVVWYQIFTERFCNGDTTNDPTLETIACETSSFRAPNSWKITPWSQEWYAEDEWFKGVDRPFKEKLQHRRYGGDLQGVLDKLDYLTDLGITAIYFNPLNDAPSLHKYDARNYHHVDVSFGPDPEGDIKLMAHEIPADPSTWVWTSADKLFLKVVSEAHKRGIRVILDYSWNHTGSEFWAWRDVVKNQEKSPYKDWYEIKSFDNSSTPENEFSYKGWFNVASLPEIRKVDITSHRVDGMPYEGNINEGAKAHIFAVTSRWLKPDGDLSKGIDGYRLDVADQIPMGFWRDYHTYVKSINPDAFLVGEIWWEKYPNYLMNPKPYLKGDVFDAVMFYQLYKPARYFFANTDSTIDAVQFKRSLQKEWHNMSKEHQFAQMCVNTTHDTQRLLTDFYNRGNYKVAGYPYDNKEYKSGKPDDEAYKRLRLYLIQQFTSLGSPNIYNGEEMGMWGADDPDCRKPLMWPEINFESERKDFNHPEILEKDRVEFNQEHFNFYKKLIAIRKSNEVLMLGDLEFLTAKDKLLSYIRSDANSKIVVVLNASNRSVEYVVPLHGSFTDLVTGICYNTSKVTLEPFTGLVLK